MTHGPISDFCGPDWSWMPADIRRSKKLSGTAKVIYSAIAMHCRLNVGKHAAWLSLQEIAHEAGAARSTVQLCLKQLAAYVETVGSTTRCKRYRLKPLNRA